MANAIAMAAEGKNGNTAADDGALYAALSRDDVLALIEYWNDQARRNLLPLPWFWYMWANRALGHVKPTDRYRAGKLFDAKFAASMLPAKWLPDIWDDVQRYAAELDETAKLKTPRDWEPSGGVMARWNRIASLAWKRMKRSRAERAKDAGVPPVPLPPDSPIKPVVPKNPLRGGGALLLAALVLYLDSKGR